MNSRRDIGWLVSSARASSAMASLREKSNGNDVDERLPGFSGATVSDRRPDRQHSRRVRQP